MSLLREFLQNVVGAGAPAAHPAELHIGKAAPVAAPAQPRDAANGEVVKAKDDLLLDFECRIVIVNKTGVALQKGPDRVERGRYKNKPPQSVPPHQAISFTVLGKIIVVGAVTWIPDGGQGESWELEYEFAPVDGFVTKKIGTSRVLNSGRFSDAVDDSTEAELRFILNDRGAAPPSSQSFVSRVVVVNSTDLELTNTFDSLTAGTFETAPPPKIAPRQQIEFEVRSQGTQAQQAQQFVVGRLDWTTVGLAQPETWAISYSAATGLKPTASSSIQSARLVAVPPAVAGTNFQFELKDSNDPPPPRAESFLCKVFVKNATNVVLTKVTDGPTAGAYEAKPANAIPPGERMEFAVRSEEKEGREIAAGSVVWHPEGADAGEAWLIQYAESPKGTDELSSSTIQSERFRAKEPIFDRVYSFLLSGELPPPPPPPPPAQHFVSTVFVVNNTDATLVLRDLVTGAGAFVKQPPASIPPRGSDNFSVQSQSNPIDASELVSGAVTWELDEGSGEGWTIGYERSGTDTDGQTQQTLQSTRFVADSPQSKGTDFQFTLNIGNQPPPPPPVEHFISTVVVVNNTEATLALSNFAPAFGTFLKEPPASIPPASVDNFLIQSDTNPSDGTDVIGGAVTWELDAGSGESWTIGYDRTSNDTDGQAQQQLQSGRFVADSPASSGTDFQFVLNPGNQPPPPPPPPPPGPVIDPPAPPPESKQPTLRLHDDQVDGWVENLQRLLNEQLTPSPNLALDGNFGNATHQAVIRFQTKMKEQDPTFVVDGIVGNQTWAGLRHAAPEAASTDKRAPHTFVEKGLEARWLTETDVARYETGADVLTMRAVSVGTDANIEGQNVTFLVTPPGGDKKGIVMKVGAVVSKTPTGEGNIHEVKLPQLRATFPSDPEGAGIDQYVVEAFFDKELGGDLWSSKVGKIVVS